MLTLAFALLASPVHAAVDADGDGYDSAVDCDDSDPTVNPSAVEAIDGVDNDCNGLVDDIGGGGDADGDGYSPGAGDCDDGDRSVNPGATEVCDGRDNDCDARVDEGVPPHTWYADADADAFGDPATSLTQCSPPAGYVVDNTDCDDGNASVHPGAPEVDGDGIDQDCDGTDPGGTGSDTGDTGTGSDTGSTADTGSGADTATDDTGGPSAADTHALCATTPAAALPFAGALAAVAAFARRRRR